MVPSRISCYLLVLLVLPLTLSGTLARAGEPTPAAASLVPQEALIVLQVTDPDQLIDQVFDDELISALEDLPAYQDAMSNPETEQLIGLVRFLENKYDAKLPELLKRLTGGGITLAVLPGEKSLLVVEAEDARMLSEMHDFFRTIAKAEASKQGNSGRIKTAEYRGVTGWSFAPGETHAILDNRLLLANDPETIKAVVDLREAGPEQSLAEVDRFHAACEQTAGDAVATLYADIEVLKQLPDVREALEGDQNPLVRLLFAPLLGAVKEATWLGATLAWDKQQLRLQITTDQPADATGAMNRFAVPSSSEQGALPNLKVPRQIAAMSLYRDLYEFYSAKDELFAERTSGLIFFENMMGIFFSGKDLTDEVLAETLPEVRMVVARQQYDERTGTPAVQLPAFAVLMKLRDADNFELVMKEAWQKAIGLVNFTRGQQALPGLIIDSGAHAGTTYTTAYFSVAEEEDKESVDVRFNFQPALAVQGDFLIMSSTDALARDLIEAVQQESEEGLEPVGGAHTLASLRGAEIAGILQANRDSMVRQNMVEKGHSRDQAAAEIGMLIAILESLGRVELEAGQDDGRTQIDMRLDYRLPKQP